MREQEEMFTNASGVCLLEGITHCPSRDPETPSFRAEVKLGGPGLAAFTPGLGIPGFLGAPPLS